MELDIKLRTSHIINHNAIPYTGYCDCNTSAAAVLDVIGKHECQDSRLHHKHLFHEDEKKFLKNDQATRY